MIQEIASIMVKTGKEQDFEAAVAKAKPLFQRSKGCHGVQLYRTIEIPQQYTLVVDWETVDHHMVDFRQSNEFQQWRELAGPYFEQPPQVRHVDKVL